MSYERLGYDAGALAHSVIKTWLSLKQQARRHGCKPLVLVCQLFFVSSDDWIAFVLGMEITSA
jgi:hypothetical protein